MNRRVHSCFSIVFLFFFFASSLLFSAKKPSLSQIHKDISGQVARMNRLELRQQRYYYRPDSQLFVHSLELSITNNNPQGYRLLLSSENQGSLLDFQTQEEVFYEVLVFNDDFAIDKPVFFLEQAQVFVQPPQQAAYIQAPLTIKIYARLGDRNGIFSDRLTLSLLDPPFEPQQLTIPLSFSRH